MMNEQQKTDAADQSTVRSTKRPPGLVASVVSGIVLMALLAWQFAKVADDGHQVQVLNPDLQLIWKATIIASVGISTACSVAVWVRRQWVIRYAVVNAVAIWMGVAVIIPLTVNGALFAVMQPIQIGSRFEEYPGWSGLTEPFLLLVVAIAIWDSVDGIRRARRYNVDRSSS